MGRSPPGGCSAEQGLEGSCGASSYECWTVQLPATGCLPSPSQVKRRGGGRTISIFRIQEYSHDAGY